MLRKQEKKKKSRTSEKTLTDEPAPCRGTSEHAARG